MESEQTVSTGAGSVIDFAVKDYDSHDAVTTGASWKFTVPVGHAGKYHISAGFNTDGVTWNDGERGQFQVRSNGSVIGRLDTFESQSIESIQIYFSGSDTYELSEGDEVDVVFSQNTGGDVTITGTAVITFPTARISIEEIPATAVSGTSGQSGHSGFSGAFSGASGVSGFSGSSIKNTLFAVKASSESRNTTTTLADDSDLVITLSSGVIYELTMSIVITADSTTPDFKYRWDFTGTINRTALGWHLGDQAEGTGTDGPHQTNFNTSFPTSTRFSAIETGTQRRVFMMQGFVDVSSGGDLSFQWSQNTSSASDVTILAGGYLLAREI